MFPRVDWVSGKQNVEPNNKSMSKCGNDKICMLWGFGRTCKRDTLPLKVLGKSAEG